MKIISFTSRSKTNGLILLLITFYFSGILGCSYPIKLDAKDGGAKLIVEGTITNQNEKYKIRLTKSAKYEDGINGINSAVSGAVVSILDDTNNEYFLTELFDGFEGSANGYYSTKDGQLVGVPGKSYKLKIRFDNQTYESDFERLTPAILMDSLYYEFQEATQFKEEAHRVLVNVKDPAGKGNYYSWSWKRYVQIYVCGFTERREERGCCSNRCFRIATCNNCNNIISDAYVDGNDITQKLITEIPYDGRCKIVIEVRQQIISKKVFDFLDAINKQNGNSGGIFDTPPFPIEGNIHNVDDPKEIVLGYFAASSEDVKYLKINRTTVDHSPGEDFCETPPGIVPAPPCAACEESASRTQTPPPGWDD
jgi:hypothetical protein